MISKPISKKTRVIISLFSIILMLLGYTILSYRVHLENPNNTTIPNWRQFGEGVIKLTKANKRDININLGTEDNTENNNQGIAYFMGLVLKPFKYIFCQDRWIVMDSIATLKRLLSGLLVGILIGVVLGILMGCSNIIEAFFSPLVTLLAQVPATGALAIFFAIVGTGFEMYVTMIAFGVAPVLAQSIAFSIKDVPYELINKAWTLGCSYSQVIWNVIFRYILPKIIDAIRIILGPSVVYLIAAEMLVADVGFGYRLRLQSKILNMNVSYPYLAILALFMYGVFNLLKFIQRKYFPWYQPTREV